MRAFVMFMLVGLLASCASEPDARQQIAAAKAMLDVAPSCCMSLAEAKRQPLPLQRTTVQVDQHLQAFTLGGTKAFFVLYELPTFSNPYSIVATGLASGSLNDLSVFAPRIAIFDGKFNRTRFFDEKELRHRGNNLERTIFFNPMNSEERYIAFYGSDSTASIERPYSAMTTTPIVANGVTFSLYSGRDAVSISRFAPVGMLQLEVEGLALPVAK